VRRRLILATGLTLSLLLALGATSFASGSTITSSSGAFSIVTPPGFSNDIKQYTGPAVEVLVGGPKQNGFQVNINVIRQHTETASLATIVQSTITSLRQDDGAKQISTAANPTLAGASAREIDFVVTLDRRTLHDREVFAVRGGWGYAITYSALSGSQYRGHLSALAELMASWRWR
jgi:hypothetical protein